MLGRSNTLTCLRVVRLGGESFCSGVVDAAGGGGSGAMFTRHKRAPDCSRSPCRILFPCLSRTSSLCLSRCAEQSSSHSFPRLSKLLVKPGMMWPVLARNVGMEGIARTAVPSDVLVSPVAVRIVVFGALGLMLRSGAVGVK